MPFLLFAALLFWFLLPLVLAAAVMVFETAIWALSVLTVVLIEVARFIFHALFPRRKS